MCGEKRERRVLTHWLKAGWNVKNVFLGIEGIMTEAFESCCARGGDSDSVKAVGWVHLLFMLGSLSMPLVLMMVIMIMITLAQHSLYSRHSSRYFTYNSFTPHNNSAS